MDMTFHAPFIFIFGVLEVNIAIVAASTPIFWPIIVTLSANKIFVVNEVDVRVEAASRSSFGSGRGITLADQASWRKDAGEDAVERTDQISVVTKTFDRNDYRHKKSNSSLRGRALGLDFGYRASQDSQRCLQPMTSNENSSSKGSLRGPEGDDYDWFLELNKEMAGGRTTTTVERAEIPVEHIKAFDSRQGSS